MLTLLRISAIWNNNMFLVLFFASFIGPPTDMGKFGVRELEASKIILCFDELELNDGK